MATSCRYEFQLQHFGFTDTKPSLFQQLQWTRNRWVFVFYRLFMATYVTAWYFYSFHPGSDLDRFFFLSNWSEGVMMIYFIFALAISIHALVTRNRETDGSENKLRWYYIINWLLFTVATTAGIETTVFYAVTIAPGRTVERNTQPRTFHIHFVNSILLLIDVFMVAFPDRFLHFTYTILYGLIYTAFLLILHFTGVNSAVYSQINFTGNLGSAIGWLVVAVIVMPFVLHTLIFGLYHLRAFIARKTVLKEQPSSEKVEMGATNPAFAEDVEKA